MNNSNFSSNASSQGSILLTPIGGFLNFSTTSFRPPPIPQNFSGQQEAMEFLANLPEIESWESAIQRISFNNDSFFMISMAIVIFLMQCGFAFLEAGSVRSKNTTNILIKNLLDSCISSIAYWFLGWGLAYGEDRWGFIGGSQFLLIGLPDSEFPRWFFQFVFAATASTIVSGALAERCEFRAYFAYCGFLTGVVYPVITHWAWSEQGWLAKNGFRDFAGSGVVHFHGGCSALVGAMLLGPRIRRFDRPGAPAQDLLGHSVPFTALGGFILMFGFFAFNGGSQASITKQGDGKVVARAMCNTMLCGGWAALTVLIVNRTVMKRRKWSLLQSINAVLTGMVAACASCDALEPWACVVVGSGAGIVYQCVSTLVEAMEIDDPVDAVAVHGGGGLWGLLAGPIMMNGGLLLAQDKKSALTLAWNLVGASAIFGWSVFLMGGLFLLLKIVGIFRVTEDVEIRGLDIFKHGEPAYPVAAYGHGWADVETAIATVRSRLESLGNIDAGNPMPSLSPRMVDASVFLSPAVGDGAKGYESAEMEAMKEKPQYAKTKC